MAYKVSFQIRDDQTALGNLIIDKQGVAKLSDIFMRAKQNQGFNPADLSDLWNVVNEWCFTDSEFVRLKDEFEQIKEDISLFQGLVSDIWLAMASGAKEICAAADWVVGSKTWVEQYKATKQIAASLYNELKSKGYQFPLSQQQEYDKRYWDVMNSCTQTERVQEYFERQKRQALANGDPLANQKFVEAMLATGCYTQEQAAHQLKMAKLWDQMAANGVVKQEVRDVKSGRTSEAFTAGATESVLAPVLITQQVLIDLWEGINAVYDNPMAQDNCIAILYDVMYSVYKEAEIPTPLPPVRDLNNVWEKAQGVMGILEMRQNQGLIDSAGVQMSGKDYKTIKDLTFQVPGVETGVTEGYITATAELVNKWYNIIADNNDDLAITKFCEILADCLSTADIDFSSVINRTDNIGDKRSRMSGLVALINQHSSAFDNAVPQVYYDKLDKILRMK